MQAYKLNVTIAEDRVVKLPSDLPTGPAELIVLVQEWRPEGSDVETMLHLVEKWRVKRLDRRSKEELDRYLEEERASWGDNQ
jgi:hypothetical protein